MYHTTVDTPTILPAAERIIVIGDIHGDLGRLMDILYSTQIINQNMQWTAQPANTVVVQLGDQIDSISRTPSTKDAQWERLNDIEVLKFMDQLDVLARRHGGRAISLIGNHELMNVMGDFSYVSSVSMTKSYGQEVRKQMFTVGGNLAQRLSRRNIIQKVGSLLFVHAGLLPHHLQIVGDTQIHRINEAFRKFLRKEPISDEDQKILFQVIIHDDGILWTRKFMELQSNPTELSQLLDTVLEKTECTKMFVGHNTVAHIGTVEGKLWFTDSGISRAYGNKEFEALDIRNDGAQLNILRITKTNDL